MDGTPLLATLRRAALGAGALAALVAVTPGRAPVVRPVADTTYPTNAATTSGTVPARLTGRGRRYGRWEARVRAEQYSGDGTPYHVVWELVPTSGYHCGARSIVLAEYALGTSEARMYLRSTSGTELTASTALNLGPGPFHTYAVEVTEDHMSWFVDTPVLMTERRLEARTGATYAVRFRDARSTDEPGPDADGLGPLLLARPDARRSRHRRPPWARTPTPAELRKAGGRSPGACTTRRGRRTTCRAPR